VRRSGTIDLEPMLASMAQTAQVDEVATRILDAAAELVAKHGLRRCSVEEIAERSGLGRTTVYRRFESRDQILQAVLAREIRRFFAAIAEAVGQGGAIEDRVVEGFLAGLRAVHRSVLPELARQEPELLRLVTTDGGPVIATARDFLVAELRRTTGKKVERRAAAVAEVLVRLAISFSLTPESVVPLRDDKASRVALHDLLDPLLKGGRR
jgi:AcrR family transcriptional regulator